MNTLFKNQLLCTLAGLLFGFGSPSFADDVLLFPYFDSNGENGVYLMWSQDGRQFHQVNDGKVIFTPPQWKGQNLTRDPSIVFHEGVYHMVWTSNWNGPCFGYASSRDLKKWSEPKMIRPFPEGTEQPKNVWAPELLRDHVAGNFKIVWSSTLPSELEDKDGSEDTHGYDHRMFYVETTDFVEFSKPKLIYQDLNYSVIDAQIAFVPSEKEDAEGRWIMVLKKEMPREQGGKNLRLAFSPAKIGPESFRDPTEPIVGSGSPIQGNQMVEGASLVHWNNQWHLFWDSYQRGHYSLAVSKDLKLWQDVTSELSIPARHPRHGTVFGANSQHIGWDLDAAE